VQDNFFPIKPMVHVLIALKTISYLQANNDVVRAGRIQTSYLQAKFFPFKPMLQS